MLYLGIDQHARQLTISLRDETGDVLQARQVDPQRAMRELVRVLRPGNERFANIPMPFAWLSC